jgi:beta-N-acetylhexosaminidase
MSCQTKTKKAEKKVDDSSITIDAKIGQLLLFGIGSSESIDENNKFLKSVKANNLGGILIYEKNIAKGSSKSKLKELIKKFKGASKIPLLVSIDEEGGKVNRLKPKYGFPKTVSAYYLGKTNNLDSTKHYSDLIAHNLYLSGINVNYAPVLDYHNPSSPPLGKLERCFSNDPEEIIKHSRQVIESHRYFNVKTVLKHFPGHGNSQKDSHLDVTDVSKYWKAEELIPYERLIKENKVDAIMTAHIVNDKLDSLLLPATLSKKIITGLLREQMGFDGIIISDDMHMKAISDHYGFEQAIEMSINAGVDILMFSNNIAKELEIVPEDVILKIKKMIDDGKISEKRINISYQRVLKFKETLK